MRNTRTFTVLTTLSIFLFLTGCEAEYTDPPVHGTWSLVAMSSEYKGSIVELFDFAEDECKDNYQGPLTLSKEIQREVSLTDQTLAGSGTETQGNKIDTIEEDNILIYIITLEDDRTYDVNVDFEMIVFNEIKKGAVKIFDKNWFSEEVNGVTELVFSDFPMVDPGNRGIVYREQRFSLDELEEGSAMKLSSSVVDQRVEEIDEDIVNVDGAGSQDGCVMSIQRTTIETYNVEWTLSQ